MRRSQPARGQLAPLGAVTGEIAGAMAVVSQMTLLCPPGFDDWVRRETAGDEARSAAHRPAVPRRASRRRFAPSSRRSPPSGRSTFTPHTGADIDGAVRSSAEHLADLEAVDGRSVIFPLCVSTGYEAENRRVIAECQADPERLVPFSDLAWIWRVLPKHPNIFFFAAWLVPADLLALPLEERARAELEATGPRPHKALRSGVDALTPSELRLARMAAEGMANREIAQSLFITAKTVETHLRHVYQKLSVAKRVELAGRL